MTVLVVLSSQNNRSAPDSVPRRIVSELPSVTIDVVHIDQQGATAIPYFWVQGTRPAEFESVVDADESIEIVDRIERTENGTFYKAAWEVDSPIIHCVSESGGIVLEAAGDADEWRLKIWFEDRETASSFQECCRTLGVPLTIHRISSVAEYFAGTDLSLSNRQREALVLAYREGYFDEPRRVTQAQLGEQLGISSSAFGRRLRRGIETMIDETIVE
ncbi:helix-turn-helix domain-containing protein [Halovivax gelatinilyticus]|uniref:helix-turn-helix domain-containing protein n=1 Tax=Halovivax gelatinilyticus TaxID=2961597 RepID=UPI0020CA5320|nr:helix-turn-helix domain-containing protein [Halovivax gelatinilyticus]